MADEIPLDRPLLNKLAEDVEFSPHSNHARIRHAALMAVTKAYEAGFRAGKAATEALQVPPIVLSVSPATQLGGSTP